MPAHCLTAVTGRSLALPLAKSLIISSISGALVSCSRIDWHVRLDKNSVKSGSGSMITASVI